MAKTGMKVTKVTEDEDGLTITFRVDRKSLKTWAKILQVEGYKRTEFIFPRKKKRGTMRRMRNMKRIVHCRECIYSRDLYGDGDCECFKGPTLETTPGWDHHCAAGKRRKNG